MRRGGGERERRGGGEKGGGEKGRGEKGGGEKGREREGREGERMSSLCLCPVMHFLVKSTHCKCV